MYKDIHIKKYDSLRELCNVNNLTREDIYGNLLEVNNRFWLITVDDIKLPITYCEYGIEPKIQYAQKSNVLVIGFEKKLMIFDIVSKQLIDEKVLQSVFYTFLFHEAEDCIVIVCELDVLVIDIHGNIIWDIGFHDIVTDYQIIDNKLIINSADGDITHYAIKDGTILV
ncbi:hypothetical protein LJC58_08460 [Lachnospiraceae bacterium OttesenSCG-928-D06]|nr:hypothetical protein [Lachnospiraceae bacterium OttesenSCG-928-D06]